MKKTIALILISWMLPWTAMADEGMWLALHLKRLNYEDMQKAGLKLTAEEIYSINNSSLKDAIVVLNGGSCTAEMISKEGLMLTNHHCAYGVIQSSSTVDQNYLKNGFWAMNRNDEIPAKRMTAGFLVRMEDVTDMVLKDLASDATEEDRSKHIRSISDTIAKKAEEESEYYNARVKSMFKGNRYYLFVYKTYKDVRLVAAPPEAIGKFGGDTDNWMWPRHTGDFAMLRIYTDPDGNPAEYDEKNIPLKPKHHLPISLKGVKKNDFAMIMGYPGSTNRYLTSFGIEDDIATTHQTRIKLRAKKLALYKQDMDADEAVRLMYASKYAGISNYYKNSIGMVQALNRLRVAELKREQEKRFTDWVSADAVRTEKYSEALSLIESSLKGGQEVKLARSYFFEALYQTEIINIAWRFNRLYQQLKKEGIEQDKIDGSISALKARVERFYKDYNYPTDKKAFVAMLAYYYEDIPEAYHPSTFGMVGKKFKGDFAKYADYVYGKSIFSDKAKVEAFLAKPTAKALEKDPAFDLALSARNLYFGTILEGGSKFSKDFAKGNRLLLAGMMEMEKDRKFYPDANSTLRLTYGNVLDYTARDAVHYNYFTTLEGVMEKEDPKSFEFIVPEKLRNLYEAKDYGQYGEGGKLIVNFITNNDITGGNSGSPVINGNGELIGCAFDGNWEALSGDVAFEHQLQRTIICDIRYILFIVDKYAGASHLVEEMTLVK